MSSTTGRDVWIFDYDELMLYFILVSLPTVIVLVLSGGA